MPYLWVNIRVCTEAGLTILSWHNFDFSIGYEEALKYRQAHGQYLRRNQWQDLTVQVYI